MSGRRRTDPRAGRPLRRSPGRDRRNRVVYVAVEGEATDPDYLACLNREFGEQHRFFLNVIAERNGLKPREVVQRCLDQSVEDDGETEFWALFDRDEHDGIQQAFAAARDIVQVCFSHPSFDLWLLLHFASFQGSQHGSSRIVHEKLRRQEGFAEFGRRGKGLAAAQLRQLAGREMVATKHALQLVDRCPNGVCSAAHGHADHCDPLHRDPSTDVWRLLAALQIVNI